MIIKGRVVGIQNYGVFLEFDNGYTGLLHISRIGTKYIKDINTLFKKNDEIYCKVIEEDKKEKHYLLTTLDIDYHTGDKFKYYNNGFYILNKNLPKWVEDKKKEYNITVES